MYLFKLLFLILLFSSCKTNQSGQTQSIKGADYCIIDNQNIRKFDKNIMLGSNKFEQLLKMYLDTVQSKNLLEVFVDSNQCLHLNKKFSGEVKKDSLSFFNNFITNPKKRWDFPDNPRDAVIITSFSKNANKDSNYVISNKIKYEVLKSFQDVGISIRDRPGFMIRRAFPNPQDPPEIIKKDMNEWERNMVKRDILDLHKDSLFASLCFEMNNILIRGESTLKDKIYINKKYGDLIPTITRVLDKIYLANLDNSAIYYSAAAKVHRENEAGIKQEVKNLEDYTKDYFSIKKYSKKYLQLSELEKQYIDDKIPIFRSVHYRYFGCEYD